MIELTTFLEAAGVGIDASNLKIHLACWNGHEDPLNVFFAGNFKVWQEWQNKRNFQCRQIIALIDLGQGQWLFGGVYQILECQKNLGPGLPYRYATEMLPGQEDLIGRVIVRHVRTGRNSYIWSKPGVAIPLLEVRREKMTIGEFPGYNAAVISHAELKIITDQKIASWHGALANIKGVYLITDTSTGQHYVGKASGRVGIWQRWCEYARDGHGGNVELKKVLQNKGPAHMTQFQYAILEIADTHASDADILARESYWMKVIRSRSFGMN